MELIHLQAASWESRCVPPNVTSFPAPEPALECFNRGRESRAKLCYRRLDPRFARDDDESGQPSIWPPSTAIVCPVTQLAALLARNSATFAISCGVPRRPKPMRSSTEL